MVVIRARARARTKIASDERIVDARRRRPSRAKSGETVSGERASGESVESVDARAGE